MRIFLSQPPISLDDDSLFEQRHAVEGFVFIRQDGFQASLLTTVVDRVGKYQLEMVPRSDLVFLSRSIVNEACHQPVSSSVMVTIGDEFEFRFANVAAIASQKNLGLRDLVIEVIDDNVEHFVPPAGQLAYRKVVVIEFSGHDADEKVTQQVDCIAYV